MIDISPMMKLYGRSMRLCQTGGVYSSNFFAFIQPLRYKNKMYLGGVNTQIGFNREGFYLYLGPPEQDFTDIIENDPWIECGGEKYIIDRAEKVYRENGEVFYIWAIIRTMVEEEVTP